MYILNTLIITVTALTTAALANTCHHDNCYRALARYESSAEACFCKDYLATSTKQAPSPIATCGPARISSACSCLTTTTTTSPTVTSTPIATSTPTTSPTPTTTSTPTTTLATSTVSTCARSSASACPTPATKCCAYLCAEAQVPFDICSETDTSGEFEVCNKCPVS